MAYSWENAQVTTEVTGNGVLNVLEAVRLYAGDDPAKVRFYQASSSEMFGKVQEVPQSETTLLWPRSPYGVAKVFGHYMTINYRESYGMHASVRHPVQPRVAAPRTGVRHPQGVAWPSPRSRSACRTRSRMGNLDAQRDWGFAGDYVEAMWLMLQQPEADDYVIVHRRDALDPRAARRRVRPRRHRRLVGHVEQDPRFMRPAEVDLLIGDATQGPRAARLEAHGRPSTSSSR